MTSPRAGKLLKQGSFATLENFSANPQDRFIYNKQQFVSLSTQTPKVEAATAAKVLSAVDDKVILKSSFPSFKDQEGNFRFTNGNPTIEGVVTGFPGTYDHVIVGFNRPVTTDTIKMWTVDFIPPAYIRVDYGFDDEDFINVVTHEGNISYEFDDSLRQFSNESSPRGLYVYTIDLGTNITGSYWRIRSFLTTFNTAAVTDSVDGKTMTVVTTSGFPSVGDETSDLTLFPPNRSSASLNSIVSYATVVDNSTPTQSSFILEGLTVGGVSDGSVISSGAIIRVIETRYRQLSNGTWVKDEFNLGSAQTTENATVTGGIVASVAISNFGSSDPFLPSIPYSFGSIGPNGGTVATRMEYTVDYLAIDGTFSYTSKTSTTLVSIGSYYSTLGEDISAGSTVLFSYPMNVAQIQVPKSTASLLKYWETDGSEAQVKETEVTNIYDAVFDKDDEVYYVIRYKSSGGQGPTPSDDFSSGVGSFFDSGRWETIGVGLQRDDTSDVLKFENTISGSSLYGSIVSRSVLTSSFVSTLDVNISTLSGTGHYGLLSIDSTTNNQSGGIFVVGKPTPPDDFSFASTALVDVINGSDGSAVLRDFRFSPYALPEGLHQHRFEYDGQDWIYSRTAISSSVVSDISEQNSGASSSQVKTGFSVNIDKNPNINSGSYISFSTSKVTLSGISNNPINLRLDYDGVGTLNMQYKDGVSYSSLNSVGVFGASFKSEITGLSSNYVTISSTNFSVTGDVLSNIPSFIVQAIDEDGKLVDVSGVTDGSGTVIENFDVIRDSEIEFGDYFGKVGIASTGESEGLGGSLFFKIGPDLYKYNKTTLPVNGSFEAGQNAVVLLSGTIPEFNVYNFSYDGYSNGGLSYVEYEPERDGFFVKSISSSSLASVDYEAEIDIISASQPLAWDVGDLDTLFTVSSSDVYAFNMDETSVAFCDLSSSEPIVAANSLDTSLITAFVVNLYGEPLENKTVNFSVISGDGAVSPASDCTTASGTATTTFTAGSTTGVTVINATATNDTC